MDFSLSPEQEQLRDSVDRFAREHASFAAWRALTAAKRPYDVGNWRRMAELGWLAVAVPEEDGGLGGSPVDTMLIMEGIGRGLALEPYVGTCVIAPMMLPGMGAALRETLAAGIASGDTIVALAEAEQGARFDLSHIETRASPATDGFVLSGEKIHVLDGATADWFIVSARAPDGIVLCMIPADAPGLTRTSLRAPDHRHNSRLRFANVAVPAAHIVAGGLDLLERAVDHAIAARLAEALGAMDAARDLTLEYLKTRQQFGVPIGGFQALQHRMVDVAIACEEARAMTYQATMQLGAPRRQRRRAVSAAKARVGQNALFVGHQAVQLHGGIGTSDELAVPHYLKRLLMIDLAYGNADHHRGLFAIAEDSLAA